MSTTKEAPTRRDNRVTREMVSGSERRWRRFGEPVPAGKALRENGSIDNGIFGPGSVAWDIILHPSVVVFESTAQVIMQLMYKPIAAGIRDGDPVSRKARAGTLTIFDAFERVQRNAGMHAPMWLGTTDTAERMWKHLHNIHQHVQGDLIDSGAPELGGYAATNPRDAMWAALTEIHPMLGLYENLAYRDGQAPHVLSDIERDRYVAESTSYLSLVGADLAEAPSTMAELKALYAKHSTLWQHSDSMGIFPPTGEDTDALLTAAVKKNFHVSQLRVVAPLVAQNIFRNAIIGTFPVEALRAVGYTPKQIEKAQKALRRSRPLMRFMQRPFIERYFMRLMWGPDGVTLIHSARKLHAEAKQAPVR
jgi:uncharacterized protein (DUF2236 family)